MKIKHLLIGLLAMSAVVACKQDEPVAEPKLEVSAETVALEATAAEATFEVTSNNDWTATADADWVTLDPASGAGAAEAVAVKVTAEDNEAAEARTATVTVKAGELTKTVALTQAGTEEVPGPELPTPNADWTSDKVVSYDLPDDASSKRQLLKNIKYTFDENYFYVKLQASVAEFEAAPAEYLGVFVYDVVDGSGDGYYGWWNDAKGNTELEGEHIGVFSGKDITLTIGETPVEVITEENGDELVWTLNILRSAHPNLALENPYFAFLTYIGWEPNGALPDKYDDMLQFTPAQPEPADVDIDGKQWMFTWEAMGGVSSLIDLGVTKPGVAILAFDAGVIDPSFAGIYVPYIEAEYTVTKTNGNSGIITLSADGQTVEIPYSNATETSVHLASAHFLYEDVDCTLPANKIDIMLETPEPEPVAGLEGKQWFVNAMGKDVLVDLGLYEEDAMVIAFPAMDGSGFACYMYGAYEIEKADAKSGNIIFTQYDPEWDEFMDPVAYPYSELSESVVYISMENVFGDADPFLFLAVEEPYEIQFEEVGGADPVGEIENGDYWFIEPTTQKVMTPLAETQTYGRPTAADAVGGASTAKNAFTFTYNPDWSGYTIQDSYGRYLYSSMQSDGETPYRTLSVADSTPADDDENLAFYMWTVYNNGDGTYDVYNCATYYSISYSASYNNWEIYDPYEDDFNNLFAALVKADNPVAEPEPEPEPEPSDEVLTLTNAEILVAMTANDSSYSEYTIESASGTWTVNACRNKTNTYLQCRGKKGGYIKTPEYDKDIKSVTIHFTSAKSVYSNNTYCVFPSTWTAPTEDAAYPETGNVGKAVTDGSYSLTIPVEAGNKQVYISIIGTYAYYLDHIDVAF